MCHLCFESVCNIFLVEAFKFLPTYHRSNHIIHYSNIIPLPIGAPLCQCESLCSYQEPCLRTLRSECSPLIGQICHNPGLLTNERPASPHRWWTAWWKCSRGCPGSPSPRSRGEYFTEIARKLILHNSFSHSISHMSKLTALFTSGWEIQVYNRLI